MKRIAQSTIDDLLLSENGVERATGRLFATDCFAKFEDWLDAEAPSDKEKVTDVLMATVAFSIYLIYGVTSEHFLKTPEVSRLIKNLVESKMKDAFDE